jgi:protease-4
MDPRFAGLVQTSVSHIYGDFTAKVAQARKSTPEKIDEVAQGRVWTGAQAKERGLVDRLGSFSDALESAATRAKLSKGYRTVYIERDPGKLSRLISFFNSSAIEAFQPAITEMTQQLAGPAVLVPPPLREMQKTLVNDMAWLSELNAQRQPYAAVIHCLCTSP